MNLMVIGSFILFTAVVALITYFKTRGGNLETSDGYFLGGRSLTGGVIASSLLLTNLSAASFVGMSAQAYDANMSVMGWEVVSGITLVIVALFLLPRYLKQGITTIPDFIEQRFDIGVKKFVTYLFLVGYIFNLLPVTLYSGALAISQIFNISEMFGISYEAGIWLTVWVIGCIGVVYAVYGGLKAVAVSDTINGIALLIGGLMVPVFGIILLGDGSFTVGATELFTNNIDKLNSVGGAKDPLPFGTLFTGLILVNMYYWGTDQSIIQRGLAAKDLKEGQKGIIGAGFLKVLTPIILIIPGIIAFNLYGNTIENSDLTYSILVNDVLPKPLVGFFAAAMLGAILSTFNAVLNSVVTLFSVNILKPSKFGQGKSDKEIVAKGRKFGLVIALLAMTVAPFIMNAPNGLFDYLQLINGFFNVPIFTIIFIGYLTKRVPAIAAKVALTFFVVTYGILQLVVKPDMHYLHQSAILFVISCIIMLVIGKIKPMEKPFVLPVSDLVNIEPWEHRFKASGFVIFIMIAIYILFSPIGLAQEGGATITTLLVILAVAVVTVLSILGLEARYSKKSLEKRIRKKSGIAILD